MTLFLGILGGCSSKEKEEETVPFDSEADFDLLMDELFEDWVTSDALSMNYFLADPYSLNIERPETTFGEIISAESIQESKEETEELIERLDAIDYNDLRDDQKIVYDILRRSISISDITTREEDYYYYTGYIRPLNGIQVQLPVLLAEFNFYTVEDIERYLDLIADTHRYFSDIIEFERERSRRGFFMEDYNVDSVIEQIESYLEDRDDNLLITVFDYRIDNYEELTSQQREQFKQRNKDLVLGNVLPAYETLLNAMNELRGVGVRTGGLAQLPGGRDYAHASVRSRIGTDRSIRDLEFILEMWLDGILDHIRATFWSYPHLAEGFENDTLGRIAAASPEEYITMLQRHIYAEFPLIEETRLDIFEVHESLQEHMSPAFYLVPAIDRFDDNVVYLNPSSLGEREDSELLLFTILAHESYPGHMYQTVYFLQQSPHPIRTALSNSGYSEGWAVYSEMLSYFFADLEEMESTLLWNIRFYDMLLVSNVDFGVNVLGWDYDEVVWRLGLYNIYNTEVVERIYHRVTGVPLNSLLYTLGYIEFVALMEDTERALGNDFILRDFHRYFLDFGPAPYPIIRQHLNQRIVSLPPSQALAPAA